MVETLPGRRADRDVASQTDGTVIKGLSDVNDFAVRMVLVLVGARVGRVREFIDLDNRVNTLEANLTTEPLVAMPVCVKAIGGERIAVGTDRTSFVVVATKRPLLLVRVAWVSTQVDSAPDAQTIGGMQEGKEAKRQVGFPGKEGYKKVIEEAL